METNDKRHWLAALAAFSLVACATEGPSTGVGQLDVPLVSTGSNGAQFALAGTFDLAGPENINTVVSLADANWQDSALVLSPRVGSYSLSLTSWTLYELLTDANGTVIGSTGIPSATLLNGATQPVEILNGQTSNVVFQFSVPGSGTIVFARGTLDIDFTVEQGYPTGAACTTDIECASKVCAASGTCAAASCGDGVQNGTETSPDCGPDCTCTGGTTACTAAEAAGCPPGATCFVDALGEVVCQGGTYPPAGTVCSADDALLCPVNSTSCTYDGQGGIVCGAPSTGSLGAPCDPSLLGSCSPELACLLDLTTNEYACRMGSVSEPNFACVKVNEVSTGGPNGALDELVELYNACPVPVDLSGAQLRHRPANGVTDQLVFAFAGTLLAPNGYALIASSSYSGGGPIVGMFPGGVLAAAGGGLALVSSDGIVADSMGWGLDSTNAFIETAPAVPTVSVINSLARSPNGVDTNDNSVDFAERPRTPGMPNL